MISGDYQKTIASHFTICSTYIFYFNKTITQNDSTTTFVANGISITNASTTPSTATTATTTTTSTKTIIQNYTILSSTFITRPNVSKNMVSNFTTNSTLSYVWSEWFTGICVIEKKLVSLNNPKVSETKNFTITNYHLCDYLDRMFFYIFLKIF